MLPRGRRIGAIRHATACARPVCDREGGAVCPLLSQGAPVSARAMVDKIWDLHTVAELGDGFTLLHVDRHLLHDLSGARGLQAVADRGLSVRNPELTFATPDHTITSAPGRAGMAPKAV